MNTHYSIISVAAIVLLASCSTLEKASIHGFNSGYYTVKSKHDNARDVYADVSYEKIDVYHLTVNGPEQEAFLSIPLTASDSVVFDPMVFKKQGLDIDLTSILFKYRPSVYGQQAQLTADLNIALYAGWRYDNFYVTSRKYPLGKVYPKIVNRGFDFGVFAGPGATVISPFTTQNKRSEEYSGMIIQAGAASFLESNLASFGFALGFDVLLNPDRIVWIYSKKPWLGFIVGIALN